ncbi:DUF6427 family protein [Xanthomarina sp. F1114]|uniref:DUF6427 family protein n=1 Tax=Xanthomarina sp. F1114 TaxID=2996019 RepID=UPI00225E16C3|nr:DUF6427 family protein [Xanthomarina sp. F1114]MCX7546548.1 DUF6427 family protein [Xanthomarina sp. F1114]
MISSFFSKAKPIHFVVVTLLLFVAFTITKVYTIKEPISALLIVKQILLFGVCFFSIFVFDFLSGKNDLTKNNSYKILFFSLFMVVMPQTFLDSKLLVANLFILFALRRIISIRSKIFINKKVFDAAFWISLATLLCFWASLYFILLFAALLLFAVSDVKNWIIPFVGVLAVVVLTVSFLVLTNTDLTTYFSNLNTDISFDFSPLNSTQIIISSTVILSYFVWAVFFYINRIKTKSRSYKPSYLLVLLAGFIAITIVVIVPDKTGAEFIFLFAPLSIIMANYLEIISEKWFKEALIWVLILVPIINLVLQLFTKS